MTAKTKAVLKASINSLLADNTTADISEQDVRERLINMMDSLGPGDMVTKNSSYTFDDGDENQTFQHTDGSNYNYTFPTDAIFDFPIGTWIQVLNKGVGNITIVTGSVTTYEMTTASTSDSVLATSEGCIIIKIAANSIVVIPWHVPSGGLTLVADIKVAEFTAVADEEYKCDTSGGVFNVNTPTSPVQDQRFKVNDYAVTFRTNNLEIRQTAGVKIQGVAESYYLDRAGAEFKYDAATYGWTEI
ncbi:hypothetical protein LCGC14_1732370 [marine sediment metagenome]|uniref:Uncharacterized protein n=1 Tax=marine sediment metagenome TaxID=412755 RepID=A0A0F9K8V0_9ZZZZ